MKNMVPPPPPRGFSLIELLTVVSVIAVLTSFSIGVMGRSAASLSAEGNNVADLVALAQQNASGKNRATALVFAHTSDGRQGFAVFQLTPPVNNAPSVSSDWQQVTAWKYLPTGVALEKEAVTNTFLQSPSVSPGIAVASIGGRAVEKLGYQVFLPDSQLVNSASTSFPTLRLVPGAYQNGSFVSVQKDKANYYDILINPATGRAIVERP